MPQLTSNGTGFAYTGLPRRSMFFQPNGLGGYSALYYSQSSLAWNAAEGSYVFTGAAGDSMLMYPPDHASRPGYVRGYQMRNGDLYLYEYDGSNRVLSLTREVEGVTNGYFFEYADATARIAIITLVIANQAVRRVRYTYASADGEHGLEGDLMSVISETFDGDAGGWSEMGRIYYRYYTTNSAIGYEHGLKYRLGPEGYVRMREAGLDPETASDPQLAPYASLYYEYQPGLRRVTKARVNGKYTHTYSYATNPLAEPGNFEKWDLKTTQTLPDGNVLTHYSSNRLIIARIFEETGSSSPVRRWYQYFGRDSLGRVILWADSSAISEINPLAVPIAVLKEDEGLIRNYAWYPNNRLFKLSVQRGEEGDPVEFGEWAYTAVPVSAPVYKISRVTFFQSIPDPEDPMDTGDPTETTYSYQYYPDTAQVKERTTNLPVIPDTQNGSGATATIKEEFDLYGNVTWVKDARGFLTAHSYDSITLGRIETIRDVNTEILPPPTGWAGTPSGGGLHLVSNFEVDLLGRRVEALGPWHPVDLNGVATEIRTAEWTVYRDAQHEEWTGSGFVRGTEAVACLINPVGIVRRDANGRVTDTIEAARRSGGCGESVPCDCHAAPVISPGRLAVTDVFPQTGWSRWRARQYNDAGELIAERLYFRIPEYGNGQAGVNFGKTTYGYDSAGRRDQMRSPGGTVTRMTFTAIGWLWQTFVGTKESADPEVDNMVMVEARAYDGGSTEDGGNSGGVGCLTLVERYTEVSTFRATQFGYDYRHYRIATITEAGFADYYTPDNLGRVRVVERRVPEDPFTLLAKSTMEYDNQSRIYEKAEYSVVSGEASNPVKELTWFDLAGNVLKKRPLTGRGFTKFAYDGVGRETVRYAACTTADPDDPASVEEDIILDQTATEYDAASNVIWRTTRQRFSTTEDEEVGALGNPTTEPLARVSYAATYPDPIGRVIATANYGTAGSLVPDRPLVVPASTETCLVTKSIYNARGERRATVDANGILSVQEFDDAARLVKTIENAAEESTL